MLNVDSLWPFWLSQPRASASWPKEPWDDLHSTHNGMPGEVRKGPRHFCHFCEELMRWNSDLRKRRLGASRLRFGWLWLLQSHCRFGLCLPDPATVFTREGQVRNAAAGKNPGPRLGYRGTNETFFTALRSQSDTDDPHVVLQSWLVQHITRVGHFEPRLRCKRRSRRIG